MEKLKQYKYIILILLIILGFAFYWFEFRPYMARKECIKTVSQAAEKEEKQSLDYWKNFYTIVFQKCMNEHGFSK